LDEGIAVMAEKTLHRMPCHGPDVILAWVLSFEEDGGGFFYAAASLRSDIARLGRLEALATDYQNQDEVQQEVRGSGFLLEIP
jgi:hypothetical protein